MQNSDVVGHTKIICNGQIFNDYLDVSKKELPNLKLINLSLFNQETSFEINQCVMGAVPTIIVKPKKLKIKQGGKND